MAKGAHQGGQGGKLVTAITRLEAPERAGRSDGPGHS